MMSELKKEIHCLDLYLTSSWEFAVIVATLVGHTIWGFVK